MVWQGKVSAFIPDSTKTLRLLGAANPNVPQPLRRIELDTAFKGDSGSLALSEFRAKVDQNDISGSISLDWRKELALRFKLSAPQIDLDRYVGDKAAGQVDGGKNKKKAESKPWDLRFMTKYLAQQDYRVSREYVLGLAPLFYAHGRETFERTLGRGNPFQGQPFCIALKIQGDNGVLQQ